MERHERLKAIARALYAVPGMRTGLRPGVRLAIQSLPLSLKNRQRLYNFFAGDVSGARSVRASVRLPCGGSLKLELNLRDDLSRMWYFWGYKGYERAATRLFVRLASRKKCIFDIGANIGYYTMLAAALVEGRGQVHSFEPMPDVFACLSRIARLNNFASLRLNPVAIADHDGRGKLFLPADSAWSNASIIEGFTAQKSWLWTTTKTFASYCAEQGIQRVDLVKIDVEGAEARVLQGMGDLLDKWRPDFICEVLKPAQEELDRFFRGKAYRKFLIADDGLVEVDRIEAHPQFRDYYFSCDPISS